MLKQYEPAVSVSARSTATGPPPRRRSRGPRTSRPCRRTPRGTRRARVLPLTDETPPRVQLLQLLAPRADVAARLGDEEASALARAAALDLTETERDRGRDALTRLADLRGSPRP
ncbi:hypothetical protein [Streptomyces hawaiiensis]|uniref:hypothetical protein n=1 Tax=Streptomyces hawaiiensis TaxID=67305 RepID=UPI003652357C